MKNNDDLVSLTELIGTIRKFEKHFKTILKSYPIDYKKIEIVKDILLKLILCYTEFITSPIYNGLSIFILNKLIKVEYIYFYYLRQLYTLHKDLDLSDELKNLQASIFNLKEIRKQLYTCKIIRLEDYNLNTNYIHDFTCI
ncbi:hypothetical protein [Clostridium sp.]|uniref:hypothetical protein n=1 Tax=Clostridium sp. TaxID=1506 RepID=UPI003217DAA0